ncbi:hypothetical protein [Providencia stuartii]|uniref:hypothetical protein n=1 Tax=Providencia stuartii TaxID=588 RepID=UPI000975C9FF|nr:hypothetical protein [Providencia stuartii]OMH51861.1 hypothetical protein BTZ17_09410 [Providencia stuartii]
MYDDLNSLSRQLKMDNFSFLEIEETTQSKDEQPLSNMAIKQELPLPEKIEVVSESTTKPQPTQPNESHSTINEFSHFLNYKNNHYHNTADSASHTEQLVILSELFSSISKK